MNTKESIYEVWAPNGGLWSPWVKPVLFAWMDEPIPPMTLMEWDTDGLPAAKENVVLVLDLPCAEGVAAGLALAARGYRPVPLYNGVPAPVRTPDPDADLDDYEDTDEGADAKPLPRVSLVDAEPILAALWHGTGSLWQMKLPADAPPAFLLDEWRGGWFAPIPGAFDNRSVSLTTDFPSANFLMSRGMRRVVLVQPTGDEPKSDLAHTLRNWQDAGMKIELKRLDTPGAPVPCQVAKPPRFRSIWQRALAVLGLRRSRFGGFGRSVPMPGAGG
jgi:hypothetical protein